MIAFAFCHRGFCKVFFTIIEVFHTFFPLSMVLRFVIFSIFVLLSKLKFLVSSYRKIVFGVNDDFFTTLVVVWKNLLPFSLKTFCLIRLNRYASMKTLTNYVHMAEKEVYLSLSSINSRPLNISHKVSERKKEIYTIEI